MKGREERNDEQITKTALAQRKLIDEALPKRPLRDERRTRQKMMGMWRISAP